MTQKAYDIEIRGETYPFRKQLKQCGLWWDRDTCMWGESNRVRAAEGYPRVCLGCRAAYKGQGDEHKDAETPHNADVRTADPEGICGIDTFHGSGSCNGLMR